MEKIQELRYRIAPLEMTPSEFRKAGYRLIDQVAELLCTFQEQPVASNESPTALRALLGSHSLPEQGRDASSLLDEAVDLLFDHSVFNGHSVIIHRTTILMRIRLLRSTTMSMARRTHEAFVP